MTLKRGCDILGVMLFGIGEISLLTVFSQVFTLFVFIAVGYLLAKLGAVSSGHSKILSSLLVYVFSVGNAFKAFSTQCTPAYIREKYVLLIAGAALLLILAFSMHFAGKLFSRENYEQKLYEYSLVLANYGYFGYTMVENLLGTEALMDFMMFCLPANFYVYTYAYCILTGNKATPKRLLNPVMIAIIIGAAVGISGIPLPSAVTGISASASACMGPVSMLLAGIVMSDFKPLQLLKQKRTYVLCALRLLVIPFAVGGAVWLIGSALSLTDNAVFNAVFTCSVFFVSMPCGLNTIVFPRLADKNCEIGASLAFVSNILACVTVPTVLTAFGIG